MDKQHYSEMLENLEEFINENDINNKNIYLFGHCNATEVLVDELLKREISVQAIMDNNVSKQGTSYKSISIVNPLEILDENMLNTVVFVVARAYEAMAKQLKQLGYTGNIKKLVDYNSYAEYSLSSETIRSKYERMQRGAKRLENIKLQYPNHFRIFCPFAALGDIYYMMSYLPYFLRERNQTQVVVFTIGNAGTDVVRMFGGVESQVFTQKEMDETIQAVLYLKDSDSYIPHQDRPYVVNLYKALYVKKIHFEIIYKCGVFALPLETKPYKPCHLKKYKDLTNIPYKKSVVLSPYAKSVTNIPMEYWEQIISYYRKKGYSIYTNVTPEEKELYGTKRLETSLDEIQSVVEHAGTFIGLRSGLCDVIKYADCDKTAIYPDAFYSDTKWKMAEIYHLEGWNNIVIGEDFKWKN